MFIVNKKKIGILSNVGYDSSRIIDVYYKRESQHPRDPKKNHGNNIANGDTRSSDQTRERVFVYEIFFNVDLRKALDTQYLNLDFRIALEENAFSSNIFKNANPKNTASVNAAIFKGMADNKKEHAISKSKPSVFKEKIDLSSYIDNYKMSKPGSHLDAFLFGSKESVVLVSPQNLERKGENSILATRPRSGIDSRSVSNTPFPQGYLGCLQRGVDSPEILFFNSPDSLSTPGMDGVYRNVADLRDPSLTRISNSMKSSVIGETTDISYSTSNLSDKSGKVGVVRKSVTSQKLIRVVAYVEESRLHGKSNFLATISAIAPRSGIVGQTMKIKIDHRANVNNFYVPKKIPEIFVTLDEKNARAHISILNTDPNIDTVDIYMRTIYETSSLSSSHFRKISERVRVASDRKIHRLIVPCIVPEGGIVIFRLVPNISTRSSCQNFSSYTISKVSYSPSTAVLTSQTSPDGTGTEVTVSRISPNTSGISILRRRVSGRHRGKFEKMTRFLVDKSLETVDPDHPQPVIASDRAIGLEMSNFVFLDDTVDQDSIYEYKCMLYKRGGTSKISSSSTFHKMIQRMNMVNVEVSNITTVKSSVANASISRGFMGEVGSAVSISFDVSISIQESEVEILRAILASAGLSDYLEDTVTDLSTKVQALVSLNIKRIDMTTGDEEDLGVFNPGSIADDGFTTIASSPAAGKSYRYEIMPCLVSSQDVALDSSQQSIDTVKTFQTIERIRNPAVLTQARASVATRAAQVANSTTLAKAFEDGKLKKYISTGGLLKGTISTEMAKKEISSASNILKRNPTGDLYVFSVSTSNTQTDISIIPTDVSYCGSENTKLRWRVKATSTGNLPTSLAIDYFVVSTRKQGIDSFLGCCHGCIKGKSSFSYIDLHNGDFVGKISYYVAPVYLSGRMGSSQLIGSITKQERNSKIARRN